jgi:hypothetical protein
MRNDKHLAIKLRKQKKSYNEISMELGIPKSTLVGWFKNEKWSQLIKNELIQKANILADKRLRLMNKARKEKWERWREGYRQEARNEFEDFRNNPLFIAGINLYWSEGDTVLKNGIVRLANIDYRMIALFNKFLKRICKIPKEKNNTWLLLYPDLSENKCINFWRRATGISISRFQKSQVIQGKHPTKRLENGVCTISVNSRGLKEKLITWIDLLSTNLMRE